MTELDEKLRVARESGASATDVYNLMHTPDQLAKARDVFEGVEDVPQASVVEGEEDLFADQYVEEDLFSEAATEEDLFADAEIEEPSRPDVVAEKGFAAEFAVGSKLGPEATTLEHISSTAESAIDLIKDQGLPSQIFKWLRTSDEEYAAIEKTRKDMEVRESPIVSDIGSRLDELEELQLERELTQEEEDYMWKLRDAYAEASAAVREEVDKAEEEGSFDWDAIKQAATENPGGFAAQFLNAVVADPELIFIPQAAAAKAATAAGKVTYAVGTGAVLSAADEFARQMAETGKYNKKDIQAVAALGGIANGFLSAGGPILDAIKRTRLSKKEVTPEIAQGIIDDYGIVNATGEDLADIINRNAGITSAEKPTTFYARQSKEIKKAFKEDPEVIEMRNFYEKAVADAEKLQSTKTPAQRKAEATAKTVEESIRPEVETVAETIERTVGVSPTRGRKARAKQREEDFKAALKDDPEMTKFFARHSEDIHNMRELDRVLESKVKEGEVDQAWAEYQADALIAKGKQLDEAWATTDVPTVQRVQDALKAANVERRFQQQVESGAEALDMRPITPPMEVALRKAVADNRRAAKRFKSQEGAVDPKLLLYTAGASVGGLAGYAAFSNRPEDVIAGALVGTALPWMFSRRPKPLKRLSEWANDENAILFGSSRYITHPSAMLRSYGDAGQTLAHMIDRMHWNTDLKIANKLKDVRDTFGHLSQEQKAQVIASLQKLANPKSFDADVRNTVNVIQKDLSSILDEAQDVGLYTKDQVAALKSHAADKGYWPRVYDEVLLNSAAGEKMWAEAFSKPMSEASAMDMLEGVLGKKELPYIREIIKNSKTGETVTIAPSLAIDIMKKHARNRISARSSHLERSRKIPESLDKMLQQFLVKEPEKVLLHYYHDVYKRIEAARLFDGVTTKGKAAQDANALALIKEIEADPAHGTKAARDAAETYYRVVGDSQQSETLRANLDMDDWQRKVIDFQNSYETITKLGLAQMPNMLQAANNGTLRLLNKTGNPIVAYTTALKGIAKSFTKEGREYAELTGAALETSLLEFLSESTAAGKLTENFLRGTGFLAVEKMQRIIGANMGRAYTQHLIKRKSLVDAGKIKGLAAKKILDQMEEMGLPKNIKAIDDADLHRAGLIFSNELNFRNTPDKIPHAWNSFFGRMMRKFKSFALHQGHFIKQNVIKPAARGNTAPLVHWLSIGAGMGLGVDTVRQWIKGDERDLEDAERYLRGLAMIGGMGLLSDVTAQMYQDPYRAVTSIAGPFPSDIAKLGHGIAQTIGSGVKGEFTTTPLAKEALSTIVFPGKGAVKESLGQPIDKMERLKARLQEMKKGKDGDKLDRLKLKLKELRGQ